MTKALRHAPGVLVTLAVVLIFVSGMMFEAHHRFGISQAGATTPSTLASSIQTTTTTAGK